MTAASALSPVFQLAEDYVVRYAALNPVSATALGIAGHDTEMPDLSPEGYAAVAALQRATLERARTAPVLSERDRVAKDNLIEHLELKLEQFDAGEHLIASSTIGNAAGAVRRVFDVMPRETPSDWEVIAKRLTLVPAALASFEQTLAEGLRKGKAGARRQVLEAARQASVYAGEDGTTPFFESLVAGSDRPDALRSDLGPRRSRSYLCLFGPRPLPARDIPRRRTRARRGRS